MAERELAREDVGPDVKLRLDVAARLAFPDGSITASSLRREAKRGRLTIWRVANKDMTTLAEIDRMAERCCIPARQPDGDSDHGRHREHGAAPPAEVALASARLSVARLRKR